MTQALTTLSGSDSVFLKTLITFSNYAKTFNIGTSGPTWEAQGADFYEVKKKRPIFLSWENNDTGTRTV